MTIREGDIFRFRYNSNEEAKRFMPYHCFDGRLVAAVVDGTMLLIDTYWSYQLHGGSGRSFTVEEAELKGSLTFVCNLNDIEYIGKSETRYYDDNDVFDLSYQHHCYSLYAVRNGAKRSQAKMLETVAEEIEKAKQDLKIAIHRIESLTVTRCSIESGKIDGIYI